MSTLDTDRYRGHPTIDQGRYVVLSCLGAGGMGAVFHAYDQRLQVDRAIKVLKPELVSRRDVRQRFTREAVSMAKLTHPHVVQIFDYGQEALTLYIVMEYLAGNSLRAYLDQFGVLSVGQALKACLQVAQGLQYIHQNDLIHRDIKPGNLLLSREGLKIADFGLVRSDRDDFKTHSEAIIGTFAFMSPEQRLGAKDVDHLTDIYALAASLYLMLTLESPLNLHREEERAEAIADFDPYVQRVINRGMQIDRSRRYQTCDEMIADLEVAISNIGANEVTQISATRVAGDESDEPDLDQLLMLWNQYMTADEGQTDVNSCSLLAPTIIPSDDLFAQTIPPRDQVMDVQPSGAIKRDDLNSDDLNSESLSESLSESGDLSAAVHLKSTSTPEEMTQETTQGGQRALRTFAWTLSCILGVIALWALAQWSITNYTERQERDANLARLYPLEELKAPELSIALKIEEALLNLRLREAESLTLKLSDPTNRSMLLLAVRTIEKKLYRFNAPVLFQDVRADLNATEREIPHLVVKSWESRDEWTSLRDAWDASLQGRATPLAHLVMLSALEHADLTLQQVALQRARRASPDSPVFEYWRLMMSDQSGEAYQELAIKLNKTLPKVSVFQLERARAELQRDNVSLAEDLLKTLLEVDSNNTPARVLLAQVALERRDKSLRTRQLFAANSDELPALLPYYTLAHSRDLAERWMFSEADKCLRFCMKESSRIGLTSTELECARSRLINLLWMGQLQEDHSPLTEYADTLSVADLDERSRVYFRLYELYIRAELALSQGQVDESTRLIKNMEVLSASQRLQEARALTAHLKRSVYLKSATSEQLTQAWRASPRTLNRSSTCLELYGESLWAQRASDPKAQRERLLKISAGDCETGLIGGALTFTAEVNLIKLHLEHQHLSEARSLFSKMRDRSRRDPIVHQYHEFKHLSDRLGSMR